MAKTATYRSVGASITRKNPNEPRNFPSTTSVSATGAVMSVSIVPVDHSCASNPMDSSGMIDTSSHTIQLNRFLIPAISPG